MAVTLVILNFSSFVYQCTQKKFYVDRRLNFFDRNRELDRHSRGLHLSRSRYKRRLGML